MERDIEEEVKLIETYIQEDQGKQGGEPEEEVYHVYDVPGGIVILREGEPGAGNARVIDSEPQTNIPTTPLPGKTLLPAHIAISTYLILVIFCLMFQFSVLINPFTASITLLAKSQQLTVNGTLQLGRVLSPITLSQSQTVSTTGKGHQDALSATGTLTFYNGSNVAQTINVGTVLTGQDGVQVATDQTLTVPAANLPQIGEAAVSAHAVTKGSQGNIPAYDITIALSNDLTVKNLTPFHGGQDERDFQTVTKSDIANAVTPLKETVSESVNGALQGQLKTNESLVRPLCTTTITPDHRPGEEAAIVKVTVSETCSAVAYNQNMLQAKVTDLLNHQATAKLGAGYSMLESPQVNITRASTQNTKMVLSFKAQSTWIYALSDIQQKIIKRLIAGKNTQRAMQLLSSLPGIERASTHFAGFGDDTRMPKNLSNIHLLIFYGL